MEISMLSLRLPDFVRALDADPASAMATPHLFSKVAAPHRCMA
jgi:hypothetical protein